MPDDFRTLRHSLSVPSDLTKLVDVLSWFESCHSDRIPRATWLPVKIALAEAFTNAVRHAHANLPNHTLVELFMTIDEEKIAIEVLDRGKPFDLFAHLEHQPEPPDLYATNGRGLQLLASIADRLEYNRLENGRNCLYFERQFESGAAGGSRPLRLQ